MAFTQEPNLAIDNLKPEAAFQEAIKAEIIAILDNKKIEGKLADYAILERFGLDIAVFLTWENCNSTKFIELKVFTGQRQGGVGFGSGQGEGAQVAILLMKNERLSCFDEFIRWVLFDETYNGLEKYAIFDCIKAKKAAMGTVGKGKQNNFRINDLMEESISWSELSKQIDNFLSP